MKFSIIIPSFQQAEFIERTILSILNQEGDFEVECIVMDGGSSDGTIEVLKKYEDRISWVSEPDEGQSDAINKGWKRATGDIITYLNSDDTYQPGAFAFVNQFFKHHPNFKWVYGKAHIIDRHDQPIRRWITCYKNYLLRKYSYKKLLAENFISQPAVFLRNQVVCEMGFLDVNQHLVMDYEYWLRIGAKYPAGVIPEYLANFRWYENSKSGQTFKKQFHQELEVAKKYAKGKKWPILLHTFNYYKIVGIYTLLSWVRRNKDRIFGGRQPE